MHTTLRRTKGCNCNIENSDKRTLRSSLRSKRKFSAMAKRGNVQEIAIMNKLNQKQEQIKPDHKEGIGMRYQIEAVTYNRRTPDSIRGL